MTSQLHCNNEKICYLYRDACIGLKTNPKCKISPCSNDTRLHHHQPATSEIRSMQEDEDGHISWQRMNEQALAEHDATIYSKAHEELLKDINVAEKKLLAYFDTGYPSDDCLTIKEVFDSLRSRYEGE